MEQNGVLWQKRLLSGFQIKTASAITEALILFCFGGLAVFIHQALRMPMHLPGKQGLIWIALLAAGKYSSRLGLSGSLTGVGAAIASLCFVNHDPFAWLIYFVAGCVTDFIFAGTPRTMLNIIFITLSFGIIHTLKPVIRGIIELSTGITESSLSGGIGYPMLTHFVFGVAGSLIGIFAGKAILKIRTKKEA